MGVIQCTRKIAASDTEAGSLQLVFCPPRASWFPGKVAEEEEEEEEEERGGARDLSAGRVNNARILDAEA